eukprot:tig00000523_g1876.t1
MRGSGAAVPVIEELRVFGQPASGASRAFQEACSVGPRAPPALTSPAAPTPSSSPAAVAPPPSFGGTLFASSSGEAAPRPAKRARTAPEPPPAPPERPRDRDVPPAFIDPITQEIMDEPIRLPSGKVVDRSTRAHARSPCTPFSSDISSISATDPFSGLPLRWSDVQIESRLRSSIRRFELELRSERPAAAAGGGGPERAAGAQEQPARDRDSTACTWARPRAAARRRGRRGPGARQVPHYYRQVPH